MGSITINCTTCGRSLRVPAKPGRYTRTCSLKRDGCGDRWALTVTERVERVDHRGQHLANITATTVELNYLDSAESRTTDLLRAAGLLPADQPV